MTDALAQVASFHYRSSYVFGVSDARGARGMLAKGSVAAALGELVRGLRAAQPSESGDDEGSREWRVLADLANAGGCLLGGPIPTDAGGREHDVEFLPGVGQWRKFTKPPNAGYFVDLEDESEPMMLPGTPARYLERLKLSAEIFGDDVQFLGVHVENLQVGRNLRIVTSQRHLEGNAPDWEVIEQWLVHLRFERVPGVSLGGYESQTWRQGNVWLFDVRPPNLVLVGNELVPIDIICQRT